MKPLKYKTRLVLLALLALFAALAAPAARAADDLWVYYESESGVFKARIPENHTTKIYSLMTGDRTMLSSEETAAIVDQRPFKNAVKSYIIKFDQTLGGPLSAEDTRILLDREMTFYETYYKANYKAVVTGKTIKLIQGNVGGELNLKFTDPQLGEQNLKALIIFSAATRLEQILIGPDDVINSFKSRDFFSSLAFEDGIALNKDLMKDKWKAYPSPLDIFTVYIPDGASPYFPAQPTSKRTENNEMVSVTFKDPVRNQSIFMNIYSYKFGKDLTPENVQTVLTRNHFTRNRASTRGIKLQSTNQEPGITVMDTRYSITPPPGYDYVNGVKLRCFYKGDVMTVVEVMSSSEMVTSKFVANVINLVEFHPELYKYLPDAPASAPAAAAPAAPAAAPAATTPASAAPAKP